MSNRSPLEGMQPSKYLPKDYLTTEESGAKLMYVKHASMFPNKTRNEHNTAVFKYLLK